MSRLQYETARDAANSNLSHALMRGRERSKAAKEIGPLPEVENPERKENCRLNLQLFLETYFPHLFRNPWSPAHLQLISNLQAGILHGQSSVAILPRGFGKTTITVCSAIWAALYGHRSYTLLVASSATAAKKLLLNIRTELMFNNNLACPCFQDTESTDYQNIGDFPEACIPLRRIGAAANRQGGQTLDGELTRCTLSSDKLVFPTVPGSTAAGCVIECTGLSAGIRGKNITTSRGSLRPDMVILDDIQTDKSAKNPMRVDEQLSLLNGTLKGLAGVDQPLTMVATLTVIEADDLADKLIKTPTWRTTKFGVVDRLPSDAAIEKWAKLNQIRAEAIGEGLADDEVTARVNAAFEADREALTDGCKPTWDSFKDPGDIDAMQKIMRLYFDDFNTFSREYMNDPALSITADSQQLTIEQLNEKITAYKRGAIPLEAEYITLGCDSQTLGIFYTIIAHGVDGSAWIIDYGKYPKGMKKTITQQYDGLTLEQAIYSGYKDLLPDLMNRVYMRPDGLELKISRCLMDCSHGPTSGKIQQFIRDFNNPALSPLFGRAKNPDELIFGKKKPGELRGKGWSMPPVRKVKGPDGRFITLPRQVIVDVNAWKSALRAGLQARIGTPGSISVFNDAAANHKEYFLHLTSERSSTLTGKYGSIDMFRLLPNRANHWLDTTVYALAAGSMAQKLGGGNSMAPRVEAQFTRKRIKLSDIQNQRNS